MKGGNRVNVLLIIGLVIAGLIVGAITSCIILKRKISGTLKVDCSDPDGPYLFLELNESLGEIKKKEFVILGVDLSQK